MNNRPMKFRAWDNVRKEMMGEVLEIRFDHQEDSVGNVVAGDRQSNNFTLMQFTGLLDSKGVEVFEADIIERWSYTSEELGRQDVERFAVKYFGKDGYPAFDLDGNDSDANGLSELVQSGEWEWEVCGNIYENPNLLTL